MTDEKKQLVLSEIVAVKDLAQMLGLSVGDLIGRLLKEGILVTINDSLDFETAAVIVSDLGYDPVLQKVEKTETETEDVDDIDAELVERAPVVTVMGHVDHGKTSLLDKIRSTDVVGQESGGITQHMGAYQVVHNGRAITFLDTPGHEAFGAIRAQGAKVTDIVILVVAADDGVKPQTIEAIDLAKAAGVPIVVAITKIDKPEANIQKAKQELAQYEIIPEDWGGKNVFVEVNNKSGQGIDQLLEMVLLTADILELKARKSGSAYGVIIESAHDAQVGVVATVLVEKGTLRAGSPFVVGSILGKVKYMENYKGKRVKEAGPSVPVRVVGFSALPMVGDHLRGYATDKLAKQVSSTSAKQNLARKQLVVTKAAIRDLSDQIKQSQLQEIGVVVKADVYGSLEAITTQIEKIKSDKGKVRVIMGGLGNVNESDVLSASGSQAFIVGFKVGVGLAAQRAADKEKVKIMTYDVIYELIDDLVKLLLESIGSEHIEVQVADGEVLALFRDDDKTKIVGIKLEHGRARANNLINFTRDGEAIGSGKVKTVKQLAQTINEAQAVGEYGFLVETDAKPKIGDKVEFIEVEERAASL